ncbi:hypothetical protein TNCV_1886951 [Trichonephila clavipes]|nr:hypothetical protein TNCV_1886951 [Trichonephila clavipes]
MGTSPENTHALAPFWLLAGSVPPWFAQLSRRIRCSGNGCIGSIPNSFSDIEDSFINCPILTIVPVIIANRVNLSQSVCAMKMISGGTKTRPRTINMTREGNDRCCADRLQPRNSTSVAELANRWLDRGSECPRGCMEIRFL